VWIDTRRRIIFIMPEALEPPALPPELLARVDQGFARGLIEDSKAGGHGEKSIDC
jgi:hypothetical protein